MATPADLVSQIAAAVEAAIPGITRANSDYRTDLDRIAFNGTVYQLRAGPAGKQYDSNATATIEAVELTLAHHLPYSDPIDHSVERAYTGTTLQSILETLVAPAWWRALAAVREVVTAPAYSIGREGLVIETTITTELAIVP